MWVSIFIDINCIKIFLAEICENLFWDLSIIISHRQFPEVQSPDRHQMTLKYMYDVGY